MLFSRALCLAICLSFVPTALGQSEGCPAWLLHHIENLHAPEHIERVLVEKGPTLTTAFTRAARATLGDGTVRRPELINPEKWIETASPSSDPFAKMVHYNDQGLGRLIFELDDLSILAINTLLDQRTHGAHSTREYRRMLLEASPAPAVMAAAWMPPAAQAEFAQVLGLPEFQDVPRLILGNPWAAPVSPDLQRQATLVRYARAYGGPDSTAFRLTRWRSANDNLDHRDDLALDAPQIYLVGVAELPVKSQRGVEESPLRYMLHSLTEQAFLEHERVRVVLDPDFIFNQAVAGDATKPGLRFSDFLKITPNPQAEMMALAVMLSGRDENFHSDENSGSPSSGTAYRKWLRELRSSEEGRKKLEEIARRLRPGESLQDYYHRGSAKIAQAVNTEDGLEALFSISYKTAFHPFIDYTGDIDTPRPGHFVFHRVDGKRLEIQFRSLR